MSNGPSASPHNIGVDFLVAQIGAHAATLFAERLKPLKLTPAQAGILRIINAENGISQKGVAKRLNMYESRLVSVLDEMERMNLVERKASSNDRRFYELHLTARGKDKLRAIAKVAQEHRAALLAGLTQEEMEILGVLLAKIAEQQHLAPGVHPGYRELGK
jgi:DNA-binding MarR family transcriptional regulator